MDHAAPNQNVPPAAKEMTGTPASGAGQIVHYPLGSKTPVTFAGRAK